MSRQGPRLSPVRFLLDGLDPSGRTRATAFGALVLGMLALLAAWRLGPWAIEGWGRGYEALVAIPLAVLVVPAVGHAMRRLNDLGWAGGWAWVLVLPWLRWGLLLLLATLPSSQRRRHTDSPWRLLGLGVAGAAALLVAGSLLWTTTGVAGQGMKPALLPGDHVLVRRMPIEVGRGDVLAFRGPGEAEPRLARVVGLPGDAVAVEGGAPVIGGAPVLVSDDGWYEEVFGRQGPLGVMPVCGNGAVGFGATCRLKRALETLPGGRAYPVLDAGPRPLDRMEEVEVPSAHLFVLGDHRDAAQDSRLATAVGGTGLVPLGDVIGRVDLVLSSSAGAWAWDPRGWRWGRLLRVVP